MISISALFHTLRSTNKRYDEMICLSLPALKICSVMKIALFQILVFRTGKSPAVSLMPNIVNDRVEISSKIIFKKINQMTG